MPSSRVIPQSLEDLVRHYDHFITVSIYRISRGSVRSQDVSDLKQAVYTRIAETHYLDRYAPEKGSFSNFLYVLIRSVVVNQFDRNTRNPLNYAIGIQTTPTRDPAEPRRLVLETHADLQDAAWERRQHVEDVMARLEAFAASVKDSAELSAVLRLIYEGYAPSEIAARTGQSATAVRTQRLRLKSFLADTLQVRA